MSALALEHFSPSLLPLQPPTEITTSPPAARMDLIAASSDPPVSARLPSHLGLQPPSERTNARVNHFTPVAFITSVGFCGLPQPRYSYGAAAIAGTAAAGAGAAGAAWAADAAGAADAVVAGASSRAAEPRTAATDGPVGRTAIDMGMPTHFRRSTACDGGSRGRRARRRGSEADGSEAEGGAEHSGRTAATTAGAYRIGAARRAVNGFR